LWWCNNRNVKEEEGIEMVEDEKANKMLGGGGGGGFPGFFSL